MSKPTRRNILKLGIVGSPAVREAGSRTAHTPSASGQLPLPANPPDKEVTPWPWGCGLAALDNNHES